MTERRSAYFTIARNTVWVAKMDGWLTPGENAGCSEYAVMEPEGDERRLRVKARIVTIGAYKLSVTHPTWSELN
jgi:hypothetical protein